MSKTLRLLSLAALLTTGSAAATFAASSGATETQQMTGTQTGGQQVGRLATDDTITTRQGQYSTKPISPTANSAQSSEHPYPASSGRPVRPSLTQPIRTALRRGATGPVAQAPTAADAAMD